MLAPLSQQQQHLEGEGPRVSGARGERGAPPLWRPAGDARAPPLPTLQDRQPARPRHSRGLVRRVPHLPVPPAVQIKRKIKRPTASCAAARGSPRSTRQHHGSCQSRHGAPEARRRHSRLCCCHGHGRTHFRGAQRARQRPAHSAHAQGALRAHTRSVACAGKDLKALKLIWCQPLPWQEHLPLAQAAPGPVLHGLGHFHGWGSNSFSGLLMPGSPQTFS